MKIFKKKEEKKKIGRPKLAGTKLKKNAIIISSICIVMILGLVLGGLFDLNIIPNKLKGTATELTITCSKDEIPEDLRPGGLNEYGFDDAMWYSAVVNHYKLKFDDSITCDAMTKDKLLEIEVGIYAIGLEITSVNGIQYLKNIWQVPYLKDNNIDSIDFSYNTKITFNNPTNISILSQYISNLKYLNVSNNEATNTFGMPINKTDNDATIIANNTSFKEIKFGPTASQNFKFNLIANNNQNLQRVLIKNVIMDKLTLKGNSNITSIEANNVGLKELEFTDLDNVTNLKLNDNELKSLNIERFPSLKSLYINNNKLTSMDVSSLQNLEQVEIINNELLYLDLGNVSKLNYIEAENNNLKEINIPYFESPAEIYLYENNLEKLNFKPNTNIENIYLHNNNLTGLDLSNVIGLVDITLFNNPIYNNSLYIQKGEKVNYNKILKLNDIYNITYESNDENIINNNLLAKKVGIANVKYKVDGVTGNDENLEVVDYLLNNKIVLYDIDSSKYDVNTTTKEIDVNNLSLDLNKIEITSDDLTKEVVGDKLYIKAGNRLVETYTLKNIKKDTPIIEDKKEVTTTTTTKKTTKKYVRPNNTTTTSSEIKETTTIKNDTVSNNNEINEVTKVIYKNNNKLLLIINGIEGVLLVVLLILLIRNIKRS